jgi:hypothetical protein
MYDTTHQQSRTELDQRSGGGIEVTLFWSSHDDTLTVQVIDHFAEEGFEMAVPHDQASYAFRHPYAYAAGQGLDYAAVTIPAA